VTRWIEVVVVYVQYVLEIGWKCFQMFRVAPWCPEDAKKSTFIITLYFIFVLSGLHTEDL